MTFSETTSFVYELKRPYKTSKDILEETVRIKKKKKKIIDGGCRYFLT